MQNEMNQAAFDKFVEAAVVSNVTPTKLYRHLSYASNEQLRIVARLRRSLRIHHSSFEYAQHPWITEAIRRKDSAPLEFFEGLDACVVDGHRLILDLYNAVPVLPFEAAKLRIEVPAVTSAYPRNLRHQIRTLSIRESHAEDSLRSACASFPCVDRLELMSSIPRAAQRVTQEHVGATPLKHLSLTHSARPIAEALKRRDVFCTGITTLKLRNLSFDVLRDAAYFAQMKSLHSLTLEDIMLTEQDVLAISRTPVSTLTLKNCPGADNLLGVLAESRHLGDLRFLDISRVNVSLSSFLKFLRTADAPGLRSVHVASNAQDQTLGDGDYIMLKDAFNRGILGKQLHTVSFSHIKHLGMLKFTRGSYHRSTQ